MPVYDFQSNLSVTPKTGFPTQEVELRPALPVIPIGVKQLSDVQGGRVDIDSEDLGVHPDYVEEFSMPGFRALDSAMKKYWSGLRIPTKDSFRMVRVKIAGGDKSLMVWNDDLREGRVKLPVVSINRLSYKFHKENYSPPYLSMGRRYTSNRLDRVAKIKRPIPYLVEYEFIVWTEFKREAEYLLYQISTRFNPLATFWMYDEHLEGVVTLHLDGMTDASDKEAPADEKAKIRHEYKMTAEAWLPLPETIVPTIMGRVAAIGEVDGQQLVVMLGNSSYE